jgi:hypothetical protein
LKYREMGGQIKAISQNFGHEHVSTTLRSYANYAPEKLSKVLKNIDFSGKSSRNENDTYERIIEMVRKDLNL